MVKTLRRREKKGGGEEEVRDTSDVNGAWTNGVGDCGADERRIRQLLPLII